MQRSKFNAYPPAELLAVEGSLLLYPHDSMGGRGSSKSMTMLDTMLYLREAAAEFGLNWQFEPASMGSGSAHTAPPGSYTQLTPPTYLPPDPPVAPTPLANKQ